MFSTMNVMYLSINNNNKNMSLFFNYKCTYEPAAELKRTVFVVLSYLVFKKAVSD